MASIDCCARVRLATVPHDRGQKSQIRRGQRPAINRHDACSRIRGAEAGKAGGGIGVASVGVGHGNDSILCGHGGPRNGRRNRQPDPNQSFVQQQAVCLPLRIDARNIGVRARGAIDQTKDRVVPIAGIETSLHTCGTHGPAGLRLMAGKASPAVGAEICEESVLRGLGRTTRLNGRDQPRRIEIDLEFRNDRRRVLLTAVGIEKSPHSLRVSYSASLPSMIGRIIRAVLCDRRS